MRPPMKAVLLIDSPSNCLECPCICEEFSTCQATDDHIIKWGQKGRPSWCPLKPLPNKLSETELVFGEIHGYRGGWNDCIDEILGDTE